MSFKWQYKHMELFLETYQQYECLWNTKCADYTKSSAREKAYSSMLADLNLPGLTIADIKAKIKTIRTRYVAELSKIQNSEKNGAAVDKVYEPRLFWFKDADAFLRNVCTPKPYLKDLESTRKNASRKATNTSQHFEQSVQQTAGVQHTEPASPDNVENCKNGRKRSVNNFVSGVRDIIKQLKGISEENKQDPNEFDVFCQGLAIQLKKMPLNRALICQEKLLNVMTKERLFQLTQSQSHMSISSSSSTCQQSVATPEKRSRRANSMPTKAMPSSSDEQEDE